MGGLGGFGLYFDDLMYKATNPLELFNIYSHTDVQEFPTVGQQGTWEKEYKISPEVTNSKYEYWCRKFKRVKKNWKCLNPSK